LFSNLTEHLQFEEKKEYVEILSNVGLHVDPYISGNKFVHWRPDGLHGHIVMTKLSSFHYTAR